MAHAVQAALSRLAAAQLRHPGRFLLIAALLTAGALPVARHLRIDASFVALLPTSAPAAQDLALTRDRIGGTSTLSLLLTTEQPQREALAKVIPQLAGALEAAKIPGLSRIDYSRGGYDTFVNEYRHLFVSEEKLARLDDALSERLDYERARANPLYVDLGEGAPEALDEILAELEARSAKLNDATPGAAYFIHPDSTLAVLFMRASTAAGDAAGIDALTRGAKESFARLAHPEGMQLRFAGDLMHARAEHDALAGELILASSLTLGLVLSLMLLYFRAWRVPALLLCTLVPPLAATFAVGALTIETLNIASAFLASIIVGNGVNPALIWLSRYFEERRAGADVEQALRQSHQSVFLATLAASLAAALAYFALLVTDFRGFRDFGLLGGTGIVLTWVSAWLVLPAITVASERLRALRVRPQSSTKRSLLAALSLPLLKRAPGLTLVASLVLGLVSTALVAWAFAADPIEYDFRNLKSQRDDSTDISRLNHRVNEFMPRTASGNGIAMLTSSIEETRFMQEALRDAQRQGAAFGKVRSIYDLLPTLTEARSKRLASLRDSLKALRPYVDEHKQAQIDNWMPPASPQVPELGSLPTAITRPFTERDGTRGRILYIEAKPGPSTWDGRYLVRWSEAIRRVKDSAGERPPLAGRAPIFADMLAAVWHDGPLAIGLSLAFTCVLLLLGFPAWRERLLSLATLLLGIAWLGGLMTLGRMRLNFLNFLAYPITFGNGADYGVNILRRFELESERHAQEEAILIAVTRSGAAVLLCSMTTVIGYGALVLSANLAVRSFGTAMALSELTCFLAAAIATPAYLIWQSRRRGEKKAPPEAAPQRVAA